MGVFLPPGLGLDEEVPDYDLDVQDEEWLSAQSKERVRGRGSGTGWWFFQHPPSSP